jgi:hypothetical protein
MSDEFDAAAKRAAGQEKFGLSRGLTRRRVVQGAAWSVPVIAIAAPVPAFAGASQGILQLEGTGCKLPGASNDTYKGYAFNLTATNPRSDVAYCIRIDSVTLDGSNLGAATVVNLASGACAVRGNPFCVPASTTLPDLAIVTANAGSSSNGQLIVTYSVRETADCTSCDSSGTFVAAPAASTGINDAPPINGESCGPDKFTDAQKACLASLTL